MTDTERTLIDELQAAASALQSATEQFQRAGMLSEQAATNGAAIRATVYAEWYADEGVAA